MSRFIVVAPGSSEAAALATDELARVLGVATVDALAGTTATDAALRPASALPAAVEAVRAVGDDASIAYVQDVLVRPDRQRRGIGARLLAAALERFAHVRQLVLVADDEEKTASFYRSAGLTDLADEGCRAFVRFPPAGGAACAP